MSAPELGIKEACFSWEVEGYGSRLAAGSPMSIHFLYLMSAYEIGTVHSNGVQGSKRNRHIPHSSGAYGSSGSGDIKCNENELRHKIEMTNARED